MPDKAEPPLLFLDVDGPLLPFGGNPHVRPSHGVAAGLNPMLARIDPGHGARLAALSCELVWATSWMADANTSIAPLLGLPPLPVVAWPTDRGDALDAWYGLHWKTRHLVEWANGRAFVWIDDEHTEADHDWVRTHHREPALLHRVDPRLGLADADFDAIRRWLRHRCRKS